jgi:hypothetical protein
MNINLYSINNMHPNNIKNIISQNVDDLYINDLKHRNKQVRFASVVHVVLIPSINEYKAADIFHDIWGSLYPSNLDLRCSHLKIVSGST